MSPRLDLGVGYFAVDTGHAIKYSGQLFPKT